MHKTKYFNIRDLAWGLLLECGMKELPVDLYKISRLKNWHIITEEQYGELIKNETETRIITKRDGGKLVFIIYKPNQYPPRLRFSIAHEFGHIMLHHKVHTTELEYEADMYASRLLMPIIVLEKLGVTTTEQISKLCNTSLTSAASRLKRLNELHTRQKFLTSNLEIQVYKNFEKFIKENKRK